MQYEAIALGHKLATTFGVESKHVDVRFPNDPVGDFYTAHATWFYDENMWDCLISFKIENDEVTKVSLHLNS